jgi:hypothetical protein
MKTNKIMKGSALYSPHYYYLSYMAARKHTAIKLRDLAALGKDKESRVNLLINRRCLVAGVTLAKALGIPPQYLKKYMNSPIEHLNVNQMILLSYYLNITLYELFEVIFNGSEFLDLSFPPAFFEAVQKRNLKINGEYIGNGLADKTNAHWYE